MASRFSELIIDCHDPKTLAAFWCGVLGYRVIDEDTSDGAVEIASWEPDAPAIRQGPVPPTLVFLQVPESKTVKNRLHIDVSPIDCTTHEEVERLIALGARHVDVGQHERRPEPSWMVLADPEGNEFCVLRSLQVA
jgi:hypothetical protein